MRFVPISTGHNPSLQHSAMLNCSTFKLWYLTLFITEIAPCLVKRPNWCSSQLLAGIPVFDLWQTMWGLLILCNHYSRTCTTIRMNDNWEYQFLVIYFKAPMGIGMLTRWFYFLAIMVFLLPVLDAQRNWRWSPNAKRSAYSFRLNQWEVVWNVHLTEYPKQVFIGGRLCLALVAH